MKHKTKKK